ncbi:hypothetical protein [Brucella oryzae]|uniref:Uncharacterized protein n=1 Tax=Brucella oryzae TaxID=335286 RepID=A0A2S7IUL2_9HYPH|nr:hypothetical protein [Brucella oryzae]PQA71689.1 hypothetical protein C3731_20595 [Brucella oryzae]
MVEPKKTHRLVKEPQISARYLADYMAGSEMKRRSILTSCKYQPISRVIQHKEAKLQIGKHLRSGSSTTAELSSFADKLRTRMADSDFDRDLYDHNADYINRFAKVAPLLEIPDGERLAPGNCPPIIREGVKITADICMRLRKTTSTNKVKIGLATLRYEKGKALKQEVADWHSAFLFGYLGFLDDEDGAEPEKKLCLTIDAYSGAVYCAPGNSISRIKNFDAACAAIAERWENIKPPAKAIL